MAVLTVRPFSVSGGGITGSGSLADDSDATLRYLTTPSEQITAQFSTAGLPWGSNIVVRSITVRARVAATSGSNFVQITAYTGTGRTLINSDHILVNQASYTAVSGATWPVVFHQADGGQNSSIAVSLRTLFELSISNISELYLDINYAVAPTVVATAPTGTFTISSSPTAAWTFTSPDGLNQDAYRVIIYTDNQYTSVGFTPGVTPATYDSGVVYSSVKSVRLPPEPNETYRVYISGAQTVNGDLQGAPYSFIGYVLNVVPPAAPTITPTAENSNARIALAIVGVGAINSVLDIYEVQRSFDSGTTWEAVRGDSGQYVINVGGAKLWYDYETANGQAVVYRARTITFDNDSNSLVSAWSSTSSSASWTSSSTWMKLVTQPELNRIVVVRAFGSEDYDVPMGAFQGLGSDEAITVSGVRRAKPDSSITILSQTEAEEILIKEILAGGEPILIHAGSRSTDWRQQSHYLQVGSVRLSRPTRIATSPIRDITLPYTEISRPDVVAYPVTFGFNTWQEIDDLFSSFTALSAAYTTYGAIRG